MDVRTIIWILILIIIIAVVLIRILLYFYYRSMRIKGIENIFRDSADRLEAGEDFKPIILNGINELFKHLRRYGYIQRDSETYHEFESAINHALPINKEAFNQYIRIIERVQYSDSKDFEDLRSNAISMFRSLEKNVFIIREDEEAALKKGEESEDGAKKSEPEKIDKSMGVTAIQEKLRIIMENYPENKTFDRDKVRTRMEKELSTFPKLPKKHGFKDIKKLKTAYEEQIMKKKKDLYGFYIDFIDTHPERIRCLDIKPRCVSYLIECIALTNEMPLVKKQASEDDVVLALKIAILMAQGDKQDFITPDHLKGALHIVLNGAITLKKLKEWEGLKLDDFVNFSYLAILPVPYVHDIQSE